MRTLHNRNRVGGRDGGGGNEHHNTHFTLTALVWPVAGLLPHLPRTRVARRRPADPGSHTLRAQAVLTSEHACTRPLTLLAARLSASSHGGD
jgi:hypothetical protein